MSSSRVGFPVSIESRSIVAVTRESSGLGAVTISPSKRLKCPRTLLTIMWRTVNEAFEWTGSIVQVPAMYPGISTVVVMSSPPCGGSPRCDQLPLATHHILGDYG